jgi:APA family basic amino acid/polyamine antiporter
MAYILGASTIARGFTGYLLIILDAFGIHLPTYLIHDSLSKAWGLIDLPSTLLVIALIGVILMGIRESARITKAMVAVMLPVILLVNGLGDLLHQSF